MAPAILSRDFGIATYVNADAIALGLSGLDPAAQAFAASKIMLQRLHLLAACRESFAFETTLASRSVAPWLRDVRGSGYRVFLVYLWLDSAETAVQRVARRVESGGHSIPIGTIRRRYARSVRNLRDLYIPLADHWYVYNNSGGGAPLLIAHGALRAGTTIVAADAWKRIEDGCHDPTRAE